MQLLKYKIVNGLVHNINVVNVWFWPDTYSTTIKILDENDNVLSITTSINRTNEIEHIMVQHLHIYRYSNIYRYRLENGIGNGKV